MEYVYLMVVILLYFPSTLADKLGSSETSDKYMLFKYSFYRSLIGVGVGGITLFFTGSKFRLDIYTILTSLMFGLMLALCMIVTFYAMQVTTIAISAVFKVASVIIPCIFGFVFLEESITTLNGLGFILFIFSVFLIVSKTEECKARFDIKAILACLGVWLTNGFGSVSIQLFGRCVRNGDEAVFMFVSYCMQSIFLFIIHIVYSFKVVNEKRRLHINWKMWVYAVIGTAATFLMQQIVVILSSSISALFLFPITTGSSVLVGVIVGWLCFKEKLTLKNIIGITIGIISLILINIS